jgi:hypothetical protein
VKMSVNVKKINSTSRLRLKFSKNRSTGQWVLKNIDTSLPSVYSHMRDTYRKMVDEYYDIGELINHILFEQYTITTLTFSPSNSKGMVTVSTFRWVINPKNNNTKNL